MKPTRNLLSKLRATTPIGRTILGAKMLATTVLTNTVLATAMLTTTVLTTTVLGPAHASTIGTPTRQSKPLIDSTNPVLTAGLRGGLGNGGGCKVPSEGAPSPLFNAQPFSQQMLRAEEFGTKPLEEDKSYAKCKQDYNPEMEGFCAPFPEPRAGGPSKAGTYTAHASPDYHLLDEALGYPLYPYPTLESNTEYPNPWRRAIEEEHTGPLEPLVASNTHATSAEGRPPGPQFAHQRWDEFFPRVYSQTAQAGIRRNDGARNNSQLHGYALGEWAPGGLYHNTVHGIKASACQASTSKIATDSENEMSCRSVTNDEIRDGLDAMCTWEASTKTCRGTFDGTVEGIRGRFHPLFPEQDHQALWTFDGTFPPKLLLSRYMEGILFRHHNALPIKFEANRGFGNHFLTTHHHNGHNPAESDGFAQAFFLPGQYYDYHWPNILAGHDPLEGNPENNEKALQRRASTPCDESTGEKIRVSYPSPLMNSSGEACSYPEKLAENSSLNPKTLSYEDEDACGWRTVLESCDASGLIQIPGDWKETLSSLWFHDHMLDFTAANVYKGNAAMMNLYSGVDPGREGWKCHHENPEENVNLCLPSGSSLKWGNRDYDINLEIAGKAWGQDTRAYAGTQAPGNPTGEGPVEGLIQGQLWFNPFNTNGFLADRMTVNWLWDPYLNVRARSYRFRMLNAHIARYLRVAIVVRRDHAAGDTPGEFPGESPGISYDRVAFHVVGNDGNIMEYAVAFDGKKDLDGDNDLQEHNGILPTMAIAERWDIVVDFSEKNSAGIEPGDKLYMVNLLEHKNGKRPHQSIPLGEILSGDYAGVDGEDACDTVVGKFFEMRIQPCTKPDGSPAPSCQVGDGAVASQQDRSMDPAAYIEGNTNGPRGSALRMIPKPLIRPEELANAHHRTFIFGKGAGTDQTPITITQAQGTNSEAPGRTANSPGEFTYETNGESVNISEHEAIPVHVLSPWGIKTDRGDMLSANIHRVDAAPQLGDLEIWHIVNGGGGWSHNVHVHFEEGQILERDGRVPPDWEKWGRKDVYRVGRMDDSGSEVIIAIRFREFGGAFMEHCHNTSHEDHSMLLRWDIESPGQLKPFLTPEPQWNGCTYTDSFSLPSARTQEGGYDRSEELVGDWKEKEEFLSSRDLKTYLCNTGFTEECLDDGVPSDPSQADPSQVLPPSSGQDPEASSVSVPIDESTITEQVVEPEHKKRRGRRRGGRRGASQSKPDSPQS